MIGFVFLIKIQGSDDGFKIRIRVWMKVFRKLIVVMELLYVNIILIFVNCFVDIGFLCSCFDQIFSLMVNKYFKYF